MCCLRVELPRYWIDAILCAPIALEHCAQAAVAAAFWLPRLTELAEVRH